MTVQEVQKAIQGLSPEERAEFRLWFAQHDGDEWDKQIESDAQAVRLDWLADDAFAASNRFTSAKPAPNGGTP